MSNGSQPLECHRIYCNHFYSQPLKTDVLLHIPFRNRPTHAYWQGSGSWARLHLSTILIQVQCGASKNASLLNEILHVFLMSLALDIYLSQYCNGPYIYVSVDDPTVVAF